MNSLFSTIDQHITPSLVSAEWLNRHLSDPNLIILDASQATEFDSIQIPGARSVYLQRDFSLTSTHLPNMMPDAEHFEHACRRIGIHTSSNIVVYDNQGVHYSPRIWWMFKTMGHHNISVLNGGFPNCARAIERTAERTRIG